MSRGADRSGGARRRERPSLVERRPAGGVALPALLLWLVGALAARAPATAQLAAAARVLVLAATEDDERIEPAREAIRYWNRSFEELGLLPVFASSEVVIASPATRALENYARQVTRRAGFPSAGPLEPAPPAELDALHADVVVLLSAQKLIPFAWPIDGTRRYFVAADADPDAEAGGALRVLAHELGHALGLKHHRGDPTALMCMPCRRSPASASASLPPLSERERTRLVGLYAHAGIGAARE